MSANGDPVQSKGRPWHAILTDAAADRSLTVVEALSDHTARQPSGGEADASLSGGLAGISVLYASLAQIGVDDARTSAVRVLDDAIDIVSSSPASANFYS